MKNRDITQSDEGERGSTGGQTGEVTFRYKDAASIGEHIRTPQEEKQLLIELDSLNKYQVDEQKRERKAREALKEGKPVYAADGQRLGLGGGPGGAESTLKVHPVSLTAQFSGATDSKVSQIPTEQNLKTNPELQKKLDLQFKHEHKLQHQPSSAPRFTRS